MDCDDTIVAQLLGGVQGRADLGGMVGVVVHNHRAVALAVPKLIITDSQVFHTPYTNKNRLKAGSLPSPCSLPDTREIYTIM